MAKSKATSTEAEAKKPAPMVGVKVTVEASPPNGQLISRFLGYKLRGTWSLTNERGRTSSRGIMNMPDVPGQHLTIDVANRTSIVEDPLGFDENRDLLDRARSVHRDTFGTDVKPHDTVTNPNLSDDDIKTALWEIAGWIESGLCRIVSGSCPTRDQITEMAGNRKINQFDNSPHAPKYENDVDLRGEHGIVNAIQLGQTLRD